MAFLAFMILVMSLTGSNNRLKDPLGFLLKRCLNMFFDLAFWIGQVVQLRRADDSLLNYFFGFCLLCYFFSMLLEVRCVFSVVSKPNEEYLSFLDLCQLILAVLIFPLSGWPSVFKAVIAVVLAFL